MVQEDDVLPRATEPPFLSALHAKNDKTNPFGSKLILAKLRESPQCVLFQVNFAMVLYWKTF